MKKNTYKEAERNFKQIQEEIKNFNEATEKKAAELEKEANEAKERLKKAAENEAKANADLVEKIEKMADEAGYFCGIIITKELLQQLVEILFENPQNIRIPFRLYQIEEKKTN